MIYLHPIVHPNQYGEFTDGPRGPIEELSWILAHVPADWNAYKEILHSKNADIYEGIALIMDLLSHHGDISVLTVPPVQTLEQVSASFDEIFPLCRKALSQFDSGLLDHFMWTGQDNIRVALFMATRYVRETGRAQLLS